MRADWRALAKLLQVAGNDELTGVQARINNPIVPCLRTKRDVDDVHTMIRSGNVDLFDALHFLHCQLRYEESIMAKLGLGAHPSELARTQYVSGIRKYAGQANGPSLLVHLPVDPDDVPFVRPTRAIGQRQSEGYVGMAAQ